MSSTTKKRTITTILEDLKSVVENRKPLDPDHWIDAAFMLNLLLIEAEEVAIRAESELAKVENEIYENQEKKNMSAVKVKSKGTNEWVDLKTSQSLIKRCEELIRIAKKRSDRAAGV